MARIFQVALDLLADIPGQQDHFVVADDFRLDHNADFPAGLDGIAAVHTLKGGGHFFQLLQTLNVVLQVLAAGAGPCGRDGVRSLDDTGDDGLGFHVAMVGVDGMDHRFALLVLPGHIHADVHMGAFNLVVQSLADVMQQAGTAGQGGVQAQLRGNEPGEIGHFQRVVQHILAIAGAVTQAPQQLDQLRMDAVDAGFNDGALAFLLNGLLHFPAGLFHHFLNAGGVDAAVGNQAFQGNPGNLTAHRLKAGQGNGFRRVVDNQINAGESFNGANIPAFPANNPALHFIVGQRHHGDCRFRHMVGSAALDGQGDDFPGGLVGFFPGLLLHFHDLHGLFVDQLVFQVFQQVFLGLFHGEAGNPFQHLKLALLYFFSFLQAFFRLFILFGYRFFLGFQALHFPVQAFFLLLDPALLALDFLAAVVEFLLGFIAKAVDFILALENRFFFLCFRCFYCVTDDPFGLLLGRANGRFGFFFPVGNASQKCHNAHGRGDQDHNENTHPYRYVHVRCHTSFYEILIIDDKSSIR